MKAKKKGTTIVKFWSGEELSFKTTRKEHCNMTSAFEQEVRNYRSESGMTAIDLTQVKDITRKKGRDE